MKVIERSISLAFPKRLGLLIAATVLAASGSVITATQRVQGLSTFGPIADSYVQSDNPTSNYGTRTSFRVDGSPVVTTFIKFDVQGFESGSASTLKIYAETSGGAGIEVYNVQDTLWEEETINFTNAPALANLLDAVSPVQGGAWYALDVSAAVESDGLYSFALSTPGTTAIKFTSREGTNPPVLELGEPVNPNPSPFLVTQSGGTYTAQSQSNSESYTGTLKHVVESATASLHNNGGGRIDFSAGTFDLGSDNFELNDVSGVEYVGQGIGITTITNYAETASDTEVFDSVGSNNLLVADMTISAGGTPRSTSDALDFDEGNNITVERVEVVASRGRAIVFDGKKIGHTADNNIVRDCIVTGVPGDGIEFLAASNNTVTGCTISDTGGHGIQVTKASPIAATPNEQSNYNTVTDNSVTNSGRDGININSSSGNTIQNNYIANSSDDVSSRDGIRIESFDNILCDTNEVIGNTATDTQSPKTQKYGLNIASPNCNQTTVIGNDFSGNNVGDINDAGTNTQYQQTVSFTAIDDSYVDANKPSKNYGSSTALRADNSPSRISYLKFDVSDIAGNIGQATLRVYAETSSSTGIDAYEVADTAWQEDTIDFTNAPPLGAVLDSSTSFESGTWIELDVSSFVTGNGTVSIGFSTTGNTAIRFASDESSSNQPELVITQV